VVSARFSGTAKNRTLFFVFIWRWIRYVHTGYAADLAKSAADVIEALLKQS
jgi:hypothetical protein